MKNYILCYIKMHYKNLLKHEIYGIPTFYIISLILFGFFVGWMWPSIALLSTVLMYLICGIIIYVLFLKK
jgi:hypothetical protein